MDDYARRPDERGDQHQLHRRNGVPAACSAVMCGRCLKDRRRTCGTPPRRPNGRPVALGIGSSEACTPGGVAAWLRWRQRRKAAGKPFDKPNPAMSAGFQVGTGQKFCAAVADRNAHRAPDARPHHARPQAGAGDVRREQRSASCRSQASTRTGHWTTDIEGLGNKALDEYNAKPGYGIPIHVDAASGGFILPFLAQPEKKWDFRLKWVLSISTSGQQDEPGLSRPGNGWYGRTRKYLPEEMSFSVNYLGANITKLVEPQLRAPRSADPSWPVLQLHPPGIRGVQGDTAEALDGHRQVLPPADRDD